MRGRRLKKLIDAIQLLSRAGGVTIGELSTGLKTEKRQAYRVLDTLQDDFCFHINREQPLIGAEMRYSLDREQLRRLSDIKVADLNLSTSEIISLYFLKVHAGLYKGTGIETEIERAFSKLDVFVPEGFGRRMERVRTLFCPAPVQFPKDYSKKEPLIDELTDAALMQRTCLVEYHSFRFDEVKCFKIDPLSFFERNGGLYIFYRSPTFGNIRMLAVERIQKVTVTEAGFIYPEDFDPEKLLDSTFGLFPEDPVTVRIRFSASQARYIKERRWAKVQNITNRRDGSIVLKMTTSGWYDVKRWILSFGPDAELLEPAELREEIRDAVKETAGCYE
ncbi:MAG: helix-turn-helix transcriptional regulator [Syntrophobacteraceae bacterium]